MSQDLDIGEVAARTGTSASALRFYERRGLIASRGRNGLRRTFAPETIDRLLLIRCAQDAGFTLAQIGRFLVATPDDDALRERMGQRALELDDDIARMMRMRDSLRHAATCTHVPLVECPDFKDRLLPTDAVES
ncbi:MerR family transcriptional regulator [Gordonia sp. CPCC 205333]|uniref:MerR family transcriptional regulator n=1 Tax=Gordonia sp. CPCC 205333 TaxID=3140790 RepID=UPI003AF34EF3